MLHSYLYLLRSTVEDICCVYVHVFVRYRRLHCSAQGDRLVYVVPSQSGLILHGREKRGWYQAHPGGIGGAK